MQEGHESVVAFCVAWVIQEEASQEQEEQASEAASQVSLQALLWEVQLLTAFQVSLQALELGEMVQVELELLAWVQQSQAVFRVSLESLQVELEEQEPDVVLQTWEEHESLGTFHEAVAQLEAFRG